jgi:hypothetical protein
MIEYIKYEDKILSNMNNQTLEKQNDELLELFRTIWSDFQDNWNDNYWEVYNRLRSREERKRLNSTAEYSIEEDFEKLQMRKQTADKLYLDTLLNKIDDEIDNVEEIQIMKEKKEDKRRGCMECLLF